MAGNRVMPPPKPAEWYIMKWAPSIQIEGLSLEARIELAKPLVNAVREALADSQQFYEEKLEALRLSFAR